MSNSVVNTVSSDLQSEFTRLTGLLSQAKATILAQANTIASQAANLASHAETVANMSVITTDLKTQLDDFEKLLTGNTVTQVAQTVSAVVNSAVQTAANLVINTVNPAVANLVVNVVAQTVPAVAQTVAAPAANLVVQALDTALHNIADATANAVPATLHNLQALEDAYAKIMANAGVSTLAANVALPPQVAAIVNTAKTDATGILGKIEQGIGTVVSDVVGVFEHKAANTVTGVANSVVSTPTVTVVQKVEGTVEGAATTVESEVKTVVADVAEGKVSIGPLHI